MFSVSQNTEHCIHTLLAPSKDSDRFLRPRDHIITTNYQWLPENYIINRLLPVPFSKVYDNFALVLDIASVFCVSKFPFVFLLFLFMCICLQSGPKKWGMIIILSNLNRF